MEEIQDTGTWEERKYPLGTEEGNREARRRLDDDIPRRAACSATSRPGSGLLVFVAGPLFNLRAGLRHLHRALFCTQGLPIDPVHRGGRGARRAPPAEMAGLRRGRPHPGRRRRAGDRLGRVVRVVVPDAPGAATGDSPPAGRPHGGPRRRAPGSARCRRAVRRRSPGTWSFGPEILEHHRGPGAEERSRRAGWACERATRIVAVDGQPVTSVRQPSSTIINDTAGRAGGRRLGARRRRARGHGDAGAEGGQARLAGQGRIFIEPLLQLRSGSAWARPSNSGTGRPGNDHQGTVPRAGAAGGRRAMGLDAVGGPIRIGQVAGEMLRWGCRT